MNIAAVRIIIANPPRSPEVAVCSAVGGRELPCNTYTSRGHYPPYGSGAYFKASKTASLRSSGISVVPGQGFEYQDPTDPYYPEARCACVSYGEYGAYACSDRWGGLSGHLIEIKWAFTSGRYQYQRVGERTFHYQRGHWSDKRGSYTSPLDWCYKNVSQARGLAASASVSEGTLATFFVVEPSFEFKLNEHSAFCSMEDIGVYPHGYAQGFAAAYVEASKGFANAATNSIANMLETISAVKDLAEAIKEPTKALGNLIKTYKDPRNAWLAYRYTYTTTKLDIKEYAEFFKQAKILASFKSEDFSLGGDFTTDDGIHCHCRLVVSTGDLIPKDLQEWLEKAGFNPSLVNAWDLVPYSFVVDWFLHISDLLEYIENVGKSLTINPKEIWYSAKTAYDGQWVYFRVPGRKLDVLPAMEHISISGKTFKMRIADAISLFT